jgi:galactokinase
MSDSYAATLEAAGMSPVESATKATMLGRATEALHAVSGEQPAVRLFVPGRIEVLGKHTDYAGGRSLLCNVERGFILVAAARDDQCVRVLDVALGERADLALDPQLPPPALAWAGYPGATARRLARNFPGARRGADIAFLSDLPQAAGLSSSSAFIVAIFLVLAHVNRLEEDETYGREIRSAEDLAGYLGTVENGQTFGSLQGDPGVGTFGGSEDHTSILCAEPGCLRQYSFCPVRYERAIPMPAGWTFVVGVSGVAAEKTQAARDRYNRASLAVQEVLVQWGRATGRQDASLAIAVATPHAPERLRDVLRDSDDGRFSASFLRDRLDQFLDESTVIVPQAGDALARGDLRRFGVFVERSQRNAEQLLGNQIDETITLVRLARLLGASAASAFGAGFGGSVWALVRETETGEFQLWWTTEYRRAFPELAGHAQFFTSRPGPAALRL